MTAPVQVPMQSGSVFGDQDRDLLGDADPEVSQKLTAETAELANLSNQIGSLNTATRDLQSNKARAETELATVSQQKRDIEARLKQIRTLYDAEVNSVKAVETQLSIVRGEFVKNKQELTILEASLHALQTQFAEQKGMLQKDQTENNSLKTRIASVGEEIKQLKETLEKVKRDARQQRGMVAINKKQLSTIEGERDKIQTEVDGEKKALETMQAEAAQQQAIQRDVVSPVSSERSMGTNPFLRMQSTGDTSSATNYVPHYQTFSPPAQTFSPFHERSFDSAFEDAFPTRHSNVASPEPVSPPFPATQKPEPMAVQQTRESTLDQRSPPSIASALSPPLAARDSPTYAESATSSLAVNAPRSGVGSVNGDTSPGRISAEITPKEEKNIPAVSKVLSTLAAVTTLPTQEGPVVPDTFKKLKSKAVTKKWNLPNQSTSIQKSSTKYLMLMVLALQEQLHQPIWCNKPSHIVLEMKISRLQVLSRLQETQHHLMKRRSRKKVKMKVKEFLLQVHFQVKVVKKGEKVGLI